MKILCVISVLLVVQFVVYNGKYYLSWGCFYAMSDNLYGPYDYTGSMQKDYNPVRLKSAKMMLMEN